MAKAALTLGKLISPLLFLALLSASAKAEQCFSGSLYSDDSIASVPIAMGNWYLNTDYPNQCSGMVVEYVVQFFAQSVGNFDIYFALWALNSEGRFDIVESSLFHLQVTIDDIQDYGFCSSQLTNVFAKKGFVLGVYFPTNLFPLSTIARVTNGGTYQLCKEQGTLDTASISCDSSNMVQDRILLSIAHIIIIECSESSVPLIPNANISFIDGDTQYGSRVAYTCHEGYHITSGDTSLWCNENAQWRGVVPNCEMIASCPPLSIDTMTSKLIIVDGGQGTGDPYSIGSVVTFRCLNDEYDELIEYELVGSPALVCLSNGQWNSSIPYCVPHTLTNTTITSTTVVDELYTATLTAERSVMTSTSRITSSTTVSHSTRSMDSTGTAHPTGTTITGTMYPTGTAVTGIVGTTRITESPSAVPYGVSMSPVVTQPRSISSPLLMTSVLISILAVFLVTIIILVVCLIVMLKRYSSKSEEIRSLFNTTLSSHGGLQTSIHKDHRTIQNPSYRAQQYLNDSIPTEYETMTPSRDSTEYFRLEPSVSSFIPPSSILNHTHSPAPDDVIHPASDGIYELCDDHWQRNGSNQQCTNGSTRFEMCVPNNEQRLRMSLSSPGIYEVPINKQSTIRTPINLTDGAELETSFFTEDSVYWEPGSDTTSIYEQLSNKKYREIPRHLIKVMSSLGSGQFGKVEKGTWTTPTGPMTVAVKTLKGFASDEEEVKFLQEAAINGQFHHPNVVKLCGVVTVGYPTMIVLEFMPNGDLKGYLEGKRPAPGDTVDNSLVEMLISFSYQIANGMAYLSGKGFIHRDLAARNILVGDVCKIADFGMSRDLQDKAYYRSQSKQVPIKWTAPEAIHYKKYSCQSDVWSYGAVLYEIWSLGHKPFEKQTNQECIALVNEGYRQAPPSGCTRSVYKLMIMCWNPDPSGRPDFRYLMNQFSQVKELLAEFSPIQAHLGFSNDTPTATAYEDLQTIYQHDCN